MRTIQTTRRLKDFLIVFFIRKKNNSFKEVVTIEPTQEMDLTTIKSADYISVSTK